ncbi:MAG: hypothetical protein KAG14_01510 [Mycoplasmataceae bacterium]|nr:hypothetical protein [Mycoplasmataceae bacterium]
MNTNLHTLVLSVMFTFMVNISFAQEKENKSEFKTILGDDIEHGGYGAFYLGYTGIGEYNSFTAGGKGAWLINHKIGIGIAGSGFITEPIPSIYNKEKDAFISGGYGGFLIEPIFYGNNPVHFSIPIIIGGGGIAYVREGYLEEDYGYNSLDIYDAFFVFEPGIEIEMNMTSFFRIALGLSYRFTSDIDMSTKILGKEIEVLGAKDMNQLVAKLVFKFGKF